MGRGCTPAEARTDGLTGARSEVVGAAALVVVVVVVGAAAAAFRDDSTALTWM